MDDNTHPFFKLILKPTSHRYNMRQDSPLPQIFSGMKRQILIHTESNFT